MLTTADRNIIKVSINLFLNIIRYNSNVTVILWDIENKKKRFNINILLSTIDILLATTAALQ